MKPVLPEERGGAAAVTSRHNPSVQHAVRLGASRAYRRETGEFLAAGEKLLEEALQSGLQITLLLTTRPSGTARTEGKALLIPQALMERISPMEDAPDTLFCAAIPRLGTADSVLASGSALLLDCIQDPGNVGAILRSAEAFGAAGALLLPGCADVWSPKTLRASMGAAFRTPGVEVTWEEIPALLQTHALPLAGTSLAADARDILDTGLPLSRCLLALGNEGRGLSERTLVLCEALVRIPMTGRTESLSVAQAAAVALWEMQKRRASPL